MKAVSTFSFAPTYTKPLMALTTLVSIAGFSTHLKADSQKKTDAEPKKTVSFDESIFDWMAVFAEVLQTTSAKHYKVADPEQAMIKAIDAFITDLDAHSNFLDPKTYKAIQDSMGGEFFGIGIVIDNSRQDKDKFLLVIDTIPDGPAHNMGVKPLDKIVEINGQSLEGMTTEEATLKLKGERGTVVHVKLLRENHPDLISLDIKRDVIKEQSSLCFYLEDQNIYYLSLTSFTDTAVAQIEKLLANTNKRQYKGLILDLRNNSGGLLTSAIDIAGLFLDKGGEVVSTKDKHNKVTSAHATTRDPVAQTTAPLFILVNNYTASAAEILAGCLQVHSQKLSEKAGSKNQTKLMVFVAGTQSFGKGSVQEVIPVSNNCALKITTSLFFLPFDTAIQGIGITPDFFIERRLPPTDQMIWFNKFYGSERALHNYIKPDSAHDGQKSDDKNDNAPKGDKEKTWSERAQETLSKDNQLRETVSLISILDAAKKCCPGAVSTRKKAVEYLNSVYMTDNAIKLVEVKI